MERAVSFPAALTSGTDDWATPPDLVRVLAREFGPFDLDVCADPSNTTAPRWYDKTIDGLTQPWIGVVWCNPPYGRTIGHWTARAAAAAASGHATRVVTLLPARVDTAWWRAATHAAALIRFLPGRVSFGAGDCPAPFPSAVLVFGTLPGRHGTIPRRCVSCSEWFFAARNDAATCSARCRKAVSRSQVTAAKRDRRAA